MLVSYEVIDKLNFIWCAIHFSFCTSF